MRSGIRAFQTHGPSTRFIDDLFIQCSRNGDIIHAGAQLARLQSHKQKDSSSSLTVMFELRKGNM